MRRALCLAAVLSSGCDTVFGLEPHPHTDAAIDTTRPLDATSDVAVPDGPEVIDAVMPTANCPVTYGPVGTQGHVYHHVALAQGWRSAENACERDQVPASNKYTHLVVIDNDAERSQLNATFAGVEQWIGVSDRVVEGSYRWVTSGGPALPASGSPWAAQQPVANPSLRCVYMDSTSDFVVGDCNTTKTAWCECDDNPPVPAQIDP